MAGSGRLMRIAHVNLVTPPPELTGPQIIAAWPTLALVGEAVAQSGAQVSVVQAAAFDAQWQNRGVDYRCVAERRWTSPAIAGRRLQLRQPEPLVQAVRACRPDVIHVNGLDFARHTRALCALGVPVLVQDHASRPGRQWRRWMRRWGMARAAGVAFTDPDQAMPLIKSGDLDARLPVWDVPESTSGFTPGPREAAQRATGIYGDPAVIWIGRLTPNKDPLTLLDAVEQAARVMPDLRLWCCYQDAPLLAQVQARLAQSDMLRDRVSLIGPQPHDQIEILLRAADIYVSCSHGEGSGYALIEALACGTTPVVTAIPAYRAVTGDGTVGRLVTPGDASGFARALIATASLDRTEQRARARAHFEQHLSPESLGRRLIAVYAALIAGEKP